MNFLELPLFQSLSDQELEQMKTSGCLRTASYKKNDIIFSTGSTVSEIGIVLSGSVNVENIDFWGNKSILGNMNEGHPAIPHARRRPHLALLADGAARRADIRFERIRQMTTQKNGFLRNPFFVSAVQHRRQCRRIARQSGPGCGKCGRKRSGIGILRDEGFQFFEISDLELHLGRCCGCAVPSHEERAARRRSGFQRRKLRIDRLRSRDLKRG